jgi:hypothetical protein
MRLRWLGVIAGLLLLGGALLAWHLHAAGAFVWWLGSLGAVVVVAALFERIRYKNLAPRSPGPGWVATPERFVDPATNRLVQVYVKPDTGERAYVDIGASPESKPRA